MSCTEEIGRRDEIFNNFLALGLGRVNTLASRAKYVYITPPGATGAIVRGLT
jgi:hypothetical protein